MSGKRCSTTEKPALVSTIVSIDVRARTDAERNAVGVDAFRIGTQLHQLGRRRRYGRVDSVRQHMRVDSSRIADM